MSLQQSGLIVPHAADPSNSSRRQKIWRIANRVWVCCNPSFPQNQHSWIRMTLEILGDCSGEGTPRQELRLNPGSNAKTKRPHDRSRQMSADKKRTSKPWNRSFLDQKRGRNAVGVSCLSSFCFRTSVVGTDRKSSRAEAASAEFQNKKSRSRLSFRASSQFHIGGTAARMWLACWEERPAETRGRR